MAPENQIFRVRSVTPKIASMRPGLDGPGKRNQDFTCECGITSFNEAGAGWPRKTILTRPRLNLNQKLQ